MSHRTPGRQLAHLVNQYPKVSHTFIRREILALEAAGYEVHRFALRGWADLTPDADDRMEQAKTRYVLRKGALALLGPAVRRLFADPIRFARAVGVALRMARRSDRALPYHLVYLAEAAQLVEWLVECDVTHLHAHFGTNSTEVAMLARALGGPPFSFTVHGPEEFDKPEALGLGLKIESAAFVAGVSSFGRSQLLRWVRHTQWRKIVVVRCGIDRAFVEAVPHPCPSAPRLVCVGRICEQKGQLLLMEAAARLLASGVAFELVLVGDGELRVSVEHLARELGVERNVRITGWATGEAVRREILAARALVLPSFAEGLPVVIMEALALGRPVISTAIAGIPELVMAGENGWLVPAGDVDALEKAMREVLAASPERLDAMGRAGRALALVRHDAMREAGRLAAFIEGAT